jgi:hypothetical protein
VGEGEIEATDESKCEVDIRKGSRPGKGRSWMGVTSTSGLREINHKKRADKNRKCGSRLRNTGSKTLHGAKALVP